MLLDLILTLAILFGGQSVPTAGTNGGGKPVKPMTCIIQGGTGGDC